MIIDNINKLKVKKQVEVFYKINNGKDKTFRYA